MSSFESPSKASSRSLLPTRTPGALVQQVEGVWRLEIPSGPPGRYRLAQLDDYEGRPRRAFPWQAPLRLKLQARASSAEIPGTWGFGLWNDPFGMAVLRGAEMVRLPVLPNTAWFFFASPPNFLSLRDDLPAEGPLAATFRAPRWPAALLALGAPALPLFFLPRAVRRLRRFARRIVKQAAALMGHDVTEWHTYELIWDQQQVRLAVDEATVLDTPVIPAGPLGLVLWVDNQYAALPPDGRVGFGTLANPEAAWVEITGLEID